MCGNKVIKIKFSMYMIIILLLLNFSSLFQITKSTQVYANDDSLLPELKGMTLKNGMICKEKP